MSTISTEWGESIDREDDQETPPGADRLTNLNTTLANSNANNNYYYNGLCYFLGSQNGLWEFSELAKAINPTLEFSRYHQVRKVPYGLLSPIRIAYLARRYLNTIGTFWSEFKTPPITGVAKWPLIFQLGLSKKSASKIPKNTLIDENYNEALEALPERFQFSVEYVPFTLEWYSYAFRVLACDIVEANYPLQLDEKDEKLLHISVQDVLGRHE